MLSFYAKKYVGISNLFFAYPNIYYRTDVFSKAPAMALFLCNATFAGIIVQGFAVLQLKLL